MSPEARPLNRAGATPLHGLGSSLALVTAGEFALAAWGARWPGVWRWMLWMGFGSRLIWSVSGDNQLLHYGSIGIAGAIGACVLTRRQRFQAGWEDRLLGAALLLLSLSLVEDFGRRLLRIPNVLPPAIRFGDHVAYRMDLLSVLLACVILGALLRRLLADRREKQRLSSEFEAAGVIQRLLLRDTSLRAPGVALDAVYAPALEVGGDFYYVLDGEVVVIGDVSGKGLKAAMLVSLLVGVLRATAERRPAALNRTISGRMDGGFVTCCCARVDGGRVILANAGHPSPYLNGREVELESGLPLGVIHEAEYAETELALDGQLTFVSDGVVEAADSRGELFGFERARAISGKPAVEIADAAKAWGQNDDITVVTVRRPM